MCSSQFFSHNKYDYTELYHFFQNIIGDIWAIFYLPIIIYLLLKKYIYTFFKDTLFKVQWW